MIQRYSVYVLLLAVAVSLSSCRRAVEKARRNIRFEGIERVERQGLTGAEVVVRVMNDTGYKLVLDAAEMGVYYAGGRSAPPYDGQLPDLVATENLRPAGALRAGPEGEVGRSVAGRGVVCRGRARRPGSRENFARTDAVVGFFEYLWPDVAGR